MSIPTGRAPPASSDNSPASTDMGKRLARRNSEPVLALAVVLLAQRPSQCNFPVILADPPATSPVPLQKSLPWRRTTILLPTGPDRALRTELSPKPPIQMPVERPLSSGTPIRRSSYFQDARLGINVRCDNSQVCHYLMTNNDRYALRLDHQAGYYPPLSPHSGNGWSSRETTKESDKYTVQVAQSVFLAIYESLRLSLSSFACARLFAYPDQVFEFYMYNSWCIFSRVLDQYTVLPL